MKKGITLLINHKVSLILYVLYGIFCHIVEKPYAACERFELGGPLYAGCHGTYVLTNTTCGGISTYRKEDPTTQRYIFYRYGKWRCGPEICVKGVFVNGPDDSTTPLGRWAIYKYAVSTVGPDVYQWTKPDIVKIPELRDTNASSCMKLKRPDVKIATAGFFISNISSSASRVRPLVRILGSRMFCQERVTSCGFAVSVAAYINPLTEIGSNHSCDPFCEVPRSCTYIHGKQGLATGSECLFECYLSQVYETIAVYFGPKSFPNGPGISEISVCEIQII